MKWSDRFRTVFESAILCKLFTVPYQTTFGFQQDTGGLIKNSLEKCTLLLLKQVIFLLPNVWYKMIKISSNKCKPKMLHTIDEAIDSKISLRILWTNLCRYILQTLMLICDIFLKTRRFACSDFISFYINSCEMYAM